MYDIQLTRSRLSNCKMNRSLCDLFINTLLLFSLLSGPGHSKLLKLRAIIKQRGVYHRNDGSSLQVYILVTILHMTIFC